MENKKKEHDPEGAGTKSNRGEVHLPFCTTAPSAEHLRASDEDEPCDDSRAGRWEQKADGGVDREDERKIVVSIGDALVMVDVQKDFLPGGALAVSESDKIIPVANRYISLFRSRDLPVFATRDWHPADHVSFTEQGGIWPVHCVAGTEGANFAQDLELPRGVIIVSTATEPDKEAYSGFLGTDLDTHLKAAKVRRLFVGGLATDYCVLSTVRDGCRLGYAVFLLMDAVKAVDVNPGDGERAIAEMKALGAVPIVEDMVL